MTTKQEHHTATAQQVILYTKKEADAVIAYPLLQSLLNPGFAIDEYDEIALGYSSGNLSTVTFKKDSSTVNTLTLSYSSGNLSGVVKT